MKKIEGRLDGVLTSQWRYKQEEARNELLLKKKSPKTRSRKRGYYTSPRVKMIFT